MKQDDGDDLSPALSDANGSIAARIVSDFDQFGFRIVLAHDGSLAIQDRGGTSATTIAAAATHGGIWRARR